LNKHRIGYYVPIPLPVLRESSLDLRVEVVSRHSYSVLRQARVMISIHDITSSVTTQANSITSALSRRTASLKARSNRRLKLGERRVGITWPRALHFPFFPAFRPVTVPLVGFMALTTLARPLATHTRSLLPTWTHFARSQSTVSGASSSSAEAPPKESAGRTLADVGGGLGKSAAGEKLDPFPGLESVVSLI
jgi:hypothetical protein